MGEKKKLILLTPHRAVWCVPSTVSPEHKGLAKAKEGEKIPGEEHGG